MRFDFFACVIKPFLDTSKESLLTLCDSKSKRVFECL